MSNLTLFAIGVLISIPTTITIGVLVYAAIADGRDHDRLRARRLTEHTLLSDTPALDPARPIGLATGATRD